MMDNKENKDYKNIKTFEDAACSILDLGMLGVAVDFEHLSHIEYYSKHIKAIYKIDIIRAALDKFDNSDITVDNVCVYPHLRIFDNADEALNCASKNNWNLREVFVYDNREYFIVSGDCISTTNGIFCFSNCNFGYADANFAILGCKSIEVAKHMSMYFTKEIFDACYAGILDYEWLK
jgi:hypothetical protein